jgi:hypothetical protein
MATCSGEWSRTTANWPGPEQSRDRTSHRNDTAIYGRVEEIVKPAVLV